MASTLKELVKLRMSKMSTYIPSTIDPTNLGQDSLQGELYSNSGSNSAIVTKLIPAIVKARTELTVVVIDSYLENRAKKDYLDVLKK